MNRRKTLQGFTLRGAFSLMEVSVVVLMIGVLAACGVPRIARDVERGRAAESFSYLAAVRNAQAKYFALHDRYADNIADLNLRQTAPDCFAVSDRVVSDDSWSLTQQRKNSLPGYSGYTIKFTQDGFDADASTISDEINPHSS